MGAVRRHETLAAMVDVPKAGSVDKFGRCDAHPVASAAPVAGGDEVGGPGSDAGREPDQRGLPVDQGQPAGIEWSAARRAEGQRQKHGDAGRTGRGLVAGRTGQRQKQRVVGGDGFQCFEPEVERVVRDVGVRFGGHDALRRGASLRAGQ